MKPISQLDTQDIENIKLISFDADGVAIERGTQVLEKDGVLTVKSKVISPDMLVKIAKLKTRFKVNFSSGRNLLYLNYMFSPVLWENASLQGENGLLTLINGEILQQAALTQEELEKLEDIRTDLVEYSRKNDNVKGFEPKQFIISVHCRQPDVQIEEIVKKHDSDEEIAINWVSNEAYDIYLRRFNKGSGLRFLCDRLGITIEETMAIGNDPNDTPMIKIAGIGVTTDPTHMEAHYHTEGKLNLGGEEVVDRLLELI